MAYRSKGWAIELLDDVMQQLEASESAVGKRPNRHTGARGQAPTLRGQNGRTAGRGIEQMQEDGQDGNRAGDMLIIERPTRANPVPPSRNAFPPQATTQAGAPAHSISPSQGDSHTAIISSPHTPMPAASGSKSASPIANRRDYSLAAPTTLTTSIVAASRVGAVGARIAQAEQAGDSDTSDTEADETTAPGRGGAKIPGWVREMSFQPEDETDEVKDLFEQMRLGMEIMEREA